MERIMLTIKDHMEEIKFNSNRDKHQIIIILIQDLGNRVSNNMGNKKEDILINIKKRIQDSIKWEVPGETQFQSQILLITDPKR